VKITAKLFTQFLHTPGQTWLGLISFGGTLVGAKGSEYDLTSG